MIKKINHNLYSYLFPLLLGIVTSFSLPPYNFIILNFITFPLLLILLIEIKKKIGITSNPNLIEFVISITKPTRNGPKTAQMFPKIEKVQKAAI